MEGRTPAVGVSKEGKDGRIAESFKRPYVSGNFGRDYVVLDTEFPQESRVRENLMHGLTRGEWKPGMVAGTEAPPERTRELPPGTCSQGASLLLYRGIHGQE